MSELEFAIMDLLCEMEQCTADELKEFKVSWDKELRESVYAGPFCAGSVD